MRDSVSVQWRGEVGRSEAKSFCGSAWRRGFPDDMSAVNVVWMEVSSMIDASGRFGVGSASSLTPMVLRWRMQMCRLGSSLAAA